MVRIHRTEIVRGMIATSLLTLAIATLSSAWAAQTRFGLSAEAFAVYQRWVLAMCIGGDERALRADLLRHAPELAPAFRQAISEGPTQEDVQQVREAAQALYARRQESPLREMEISGVGRADLARWQRQSRETFVADQVQRFTTGYRANAVAALGLVADPAGRALLTRLARNPRDPLSAAAREALKNTPAPQ